MHGLDVTDKTERVTRFHKATVHGFLEMLAAMGLAHPRDLRPCHIFRRVGDLEVRSFDLIYEFLEPGQLLKEDDVPSAWLADWNAADPDRW